MRGIERENPRCCQIHRRQVMYVIGWFLKANLAQHTSAEKKGDVDYSSVGAVFDPRCLVLVVRIMREAQEYKEWTDLHASMECFDELVYPFNFRVLMKS
jgi:replication fork protection complex subunit Tof1/Swi1